jgi:hypothetical protein
MNVLDLDVYMDVLYIVCANCTCFIIPAVLYRFLQFLKPRLMYDG